MNAKEESRLTMTSIAVKTAVAAERLRCIEIITHAYRAENGPRLGCLPLAIVILRQGLDVAAARGCIDAAAVDVARINREQQPSDGNREYQERWLKENEQASEGNA